MCVPQTVLALRVSVCVRFDVRFESWEVFVGIG